MSYIITERCVACQSCTKKCPAKAITFDGDLFVIDQEKCIGCGTCYRDCHIRAIVDTENPGAEIPEKGERKAEYDCDYLVIGSGPSGLCSAVRVAEAGYKVIVMEALEVLGGAGFYATFMRGIGSDMEKEAGLPDRLDDYARAAMNLTHWELDPKIVFGGIKASADVFNWLCSWSGLGDLYAVQNTPFGTMLDMKPGKATAPYITQALLDRAKELGVQFVTGTRAEKLVMEEGRITGVIAQDQEGQIKFTCKACMIGTGNMSAGDDVGRFVPGYAKATHNRNAHRLPSNRGDGVRMLEEAGIKIDEKGIACHYLGAMPCFFDGDVVKQGLRGEGVRVNLKGERFISECVDRFDAVTKVLEQPESLTYNIIDANILEQDVRPTIKLRTDIAGNLALGIPQEGKPLPMVDFMGFPVMLDENGEPIHAPLLDLGDQDQLTVEKQVSVLDRFKSYTSLKNRIVCVADTIEELAAQMDVPVENLKKTIEHYNEMSKKGRDDDFAKYPDYMIPIEKAPFIAIKCYLGSDGAFGGAIINENCQVLNDGAVVEGLYAAGDITSGNFLKEGNKRLEIINDYTWANASGYIVGGQAAEYLKKLNK